MTTLALTDISLATHQTTADEILASLMLATPDAPVTMGVMLPLWGPGHSALELTTEDVIAVAGALAGVAREDHS